MGIRVSVIVSIGIALLVGGWWATDSADSGAVLARPTELGAGEVAAATVEVTMFVPAPEGAEGEGSLRSVDMVFVTRDEIGDWHAFLPFSPWLGCRLVVTGSSTAPEPEGSGPRRDLWFEDPCHGGTYALDGMRIDGPGARPLMAVPLIVSEDSVRIDDSRLD